jgi:hypothetical protein
VKRSDIEHFLTRIGEYSVSLITGSTESAGFVTVDAEGLSWQMEFAGTLKEIRFL